MTSWSTGAPTKPWRRPTWRTSMPWWKKSTSWWRNLKRHKKWPWRPSRRPRPTTWSRSWTRRRLRKSCRNCWPTPMWLRQTKRKVPSCPGLKSRMKHHWYKRRKRSKPRALRRPWLRWDLRGPSLPPRMTTVSCRPLRWRRWTRRRPETPS